MPKETKKISRFEKVFNTISNAGMIFSGVVIFIMMLYTCIEVIFRNIYGYSPLYAYEVSQNYFMPLIVFPALAYSFASGIMPKVEIFTSKFTKGRLRKINLVLLIIESVLIFLLAFYGWKYLASAIDKSMAFTAGGKNFLLWPVIVFVPVGFLLVLIYVISSLIKLIKSYE